MKEKLEANEMKELEATAMITKIRYVVTKASKNKEFQVGDHIYLDDDGCIMCKEAGGWIVPKDVPKATKGMLIKIDKEFYNKERDKLKECSDQIKVWYNTLEV